MTPEQVKEFVYADLNLSESVHTSKVFEVSAIRAFSAAKYMLEFQQTENIDPDDSATNLKSSRTLAQEVLGMRWEKKLEKATIGEFYEEAKDLWEDSGFIQFLEQAIHFLMESAAPKTMQSALNLAQSRLIFIQEKIVFRNDGIEKDSGILQVNINRLEAELKSLELCKSKLKKVDKIQKKLKNTLDNVLDILTKEAQVSIQDYFGEEKYKRANVAQKLDIKAQELRAMLLKAISGFESFGFPKQLKSGYRTLNTSDIIIECDTKQEADTLANNAMYWAKQRAERMLSSAENMLFRR